MQHGELDGRMEYTLSDVELGEQIYNSEPRNFHIHTARYRRREPRTETAPDHAVSKEAEPSKPVPWDEPGSPSRAAAEEGMPLVLVHGYGGGIGMFYNSAPPLVDSWPGTVYVVDMLGCGLSSRPQWNRPVQSRVAAAKQILHTEQCTVNPNPITFRTGKDCSVEEAEDFFVQGLERWRKVSGYGGEPRV